MKRIKKLSFSVAVAFVAVFAVGFFSGCGKQKEQKITYSINADLNGDVLDCSLEYSESGFFGNYGEDLIFCLQPNYLRSCENCLASGENSENSSGLSDFAGENAKNESAINSELPLKITGGSAAKLLQGGDYALVKGQKSGGVLRAKIDFTVKIPESNGRLGISGEVISLAAFYPIKCVYNEDLNKWSIQNPAPFGDPFFCDFADYEITLNVPSCYVVAGGMPVGLDIAGGMARYEYSFKNYRAAAFCLSKNFNVISQKSGNRSINCYFVKNDEENIGEEKERCDYAVFEKLTELAAEALDFFESLYGEYPYDTYSLAFVPYDYGGMEYSAFSVISSNENLQNTIKAVVHETAHQWLPLIVGNNEYSEAFLDEGFAEFSTFEYLRARGSDLADGMLKNACAAISDFESSNASGLRMDRSLNEFLSENDYYVSTYARGLVLFYETQNIAGANAFNGALKKFFYKNAFRCAGVSEFLSALANKKAEKVFLSIVASRALLRLPK